MLLIGTDQNKGIVKVPIKEEYEREVRNTTANSKKTRECYHLNEVAFEDLTLSVDHKSTT